MLRTILFLSLAASLAAPAAASDYSAKLASPANGRIVAREINWACAGGSCEGATKESRPQVLCQALAKQAGKIDVFAVDGRAFTDGELAKCNASAKSDAGKRLAAQ